MSTFKLALAAVTIALFNSGIPSAAFQKPSPSVVRAPNWAGKVGSLSVIVTFEQGADSLFARGAYQLTAGKRVGCGGETLASQGFFTMRARGTMRSFRGRFLFDSGWSPPVSGNRTASGIVKVNIRSVDKGPCPLTLRQTTEHNPSLRH